VEATTSGGGCALARFLAGRHAGNTASAGNAWARFLAGRHTGAASSGGGATTALFFAGRQNGTAAAGSSGGRATTVLFFTGRQTEAAASSGGGGGGGGNTRFLAGSSTHGADPCWAPTYLNRFEGGRSRALPLGKPFSAISMDGRRRDG